MVRTNKTPPQPAKCVNCFHGAAKHSAMMGFRDGYAIMGCTECRCTDLATTRVVRADMGKMEKEG